jgi:hypothetical protein
MNLFGLVQLTRQWFSHQSQREARQAVEMAHRQVSHTGSEWPSSLYQFSEVSSLSFFWDWLSSIAYTSDGSSQCGHQRKVISTELFLMVTWNAKRLVWQQRLTWAWIKETCTVLLQRCHDIHHQDWAMWISG